MKKKTSKIFSYFLLQVEGLGKIWNSIFSSFYVREKIALIIIIAIIIIPFSVLLFKVYIFYSKEIPRSGGSYTEGLAGQPQYLNPLFSPSSVIDRSVSYLIYSGLTKIDAYGEIVPDLAEKWDISEDEKTYTFYLKEAEWHDGEPFFSGDVFYTYSVTQDPDYLGPLKDSFKDVEIEAPEDNVIVFKLPQKNDFFIKKTTLGVLPQHVWSQHETLNLPYVEDNLRPIGINLFKFKELVSDNNNRVKSLVLERNDNYYGNKTYLDSVIFKFYNDRNDVFNAFLKKEVDGISEVTPDTLNKAMEIKRLRIIPYSTLGYKAIFINQEKNKLLSNKEIRIALNLAIDRESLSKALGGIANPSKTIYHKDFQFTDYEEDLAEAKEKLKKAGFSDLDSGGYLKKDGKRLSFTLSFTTDKESEIVVDRIKKDWKNIGVEMKARKTSSGDFEKDVIKPRNYELAFLGQNYGENKNLYPFWHSSQISSTGLNFTKLTSKRVDVLLENASLEKNPEKKTQFLEAAAGVIEGDVYAFFLYQPTFNFITEKDIKAVGKNFFLYPEHRFLNIDRWYKNSKRVLTK